jgi:hypothetical protein
MQRRAGAGQFIKTRNAGARGREHLGDPRSHGPQTDYRDIFDHANPSAPGMHVNSATPQRGVIRVALRRR